MSINLRREYSYQYLFTSSPSARRGVVLSPVKLFNLIKTQLKCDAHAHIHILSASRLVLVTQSPYLVIVSK